LILAINEVDAGRNQCILGFLPNQKPYQEKSVVSLLDARTSPTAAAIVSILRERMDKSVAYFTPRSVF